MKNILCTFRESHEFILPPIYAFGRERGWQIERFDHKVPLNWSGDGVITDYAELDELARMVRFRETPVVSRILPPRENIRTIRPDTRHIARMMVSHLTDRGFTRFFTAAARIFPEDIDNMPRDILAAIRQALDEQGLSLTCCIYGMELRPEDLQDYRQRDIVLSRALSRMEPPFAVISPTSGALAHLYRALFGLGLRVPEDVVVLSNFDNGSVAENMAVPTSYVDGEYGELGIKLAMLLERMMDGEALPEKPIFVTASGIVARRSTDSLAVSNPRLAKAVALVLARYGESVGVEDMARAAGTSRGFLSRLFQKRFGKSPGQFLLEVRLNRVCHLLDSTDLPVTHIARQCGYGSNMALSLAFKRETGLTPGAYRLNRRRMSRASAAKPSAGAPVPLPLELGNRDQSGLRAAP